MKDLKIEVVENGFIVHEDQGVGIIGKMWVFNHPDKLASHIKEWSEGQLKVDDYMEHKEDSNKYYNGL